MSVNRAHPADLLQSSVRLCESQGLKLTTLRHQVLTILCHAEAPLTAYDILKELKAVRESVQAMTVYRVLSFFESHHLVHKIASLNTYALCVEPGCSHAAQLMICTKCHQVVEVTDPAASALAEALLKRHGFAYHTHLPMELFGVCAGCQPQRKCN